MQRGQRVRSRQSADPRQDRRRSVAGFRLWRFRDRDGVNGRSWPDYLRTELEERLRTKVEVVNFGLDGIGILQMFDIASRRVLESTPDLVVIAFITDDITRERIWRTTAVVDGRVRLFTTTRPDESPNLEIAVDTVVLSPDVTLAWCTRLPPPDRSNDPIVRDIEHRHGLAVALAGSRTDLYARDRSFLLDRLTLGTPFRDTSKPTRGTLWCTLERMIARSKTWRRSTGAEYQFS
jgi:hypothetical protein